MHMTATPGATRLELELELVEARLVDLDEQELRRVHAATIWRHSSEPIEPAAPVTATTLPASVSRTCVDVDGGGLAAQQVLDVDGAQVAQADGALGDDELRA